MISPSTSGGQTSEHRTVSVMTPNHKFTSARPSGRLPLIASAISAYFYLRVVAVMYFQEKERTVDATPVPSKLLNVGILVMVVGVIVLGIFSGTLFELANDWTNGWGSAASAVAP